MEKDNDKIMDDHEYDGIKELDNPAPKFFMWIFWGTIFFSALYLAHYHFFKQGTLQDAEYQKEMAENAKNMVIADTLSNDVFTLLTDEKTLSEAAQLYVSKTCVTCHGDKGQGDIGPNLTDNYWLHGSTPKEIFTSINKGVLIKGMPKFDDQMKKEEIQKLVSYILIKFKNSNPANAKAPQGIKAE